MPPTPQQATTAPAPGQAARGQTATPVAQTQAPPGDPREVYRALQSQREVLGDQRRTLEERRNAMNQELTRSPAGPANVSLQKRIEAMDIRLIDLDKQIAQSEQQAATAAAVPGATVEPPRPPQNGPPEEVFVLAGIALFIFGIPMSLALARRVWRKAARTTVSLPPETDQRIAMIERGVEAIALEVERIGEGQRFVTQLMAEQGQRAIGAGAAPQFAGAQREKVGEERR